jgi:hypothetical protein
MSGWIWNPKTKGSGIITCIPQAGRCPVGCKDCFFQSGRSYLEPLDVNLPHIPPLELTKGRIVRMNDGNDSNNQRELVMAVAKQFDDYFFNTSKPFKLEEFKAPVVLTVNPDEETDIGFCKVSKVPNIMFVRVRVNAWNLEKIVVPVVNYYSELEIPVVLTYMVYYISVIPEKYKCWYVWKKRTLNSYYVPNANFMEWVEDEFKRNPYVYTCGWKGTHSCMRCGNCIREYFNTKERLK